MNGIKVTDLVTIAGDVHHIFPRNYLKNNGVTSKTKYNQVANYIYLDTQINIAISDDAPNSYFSRVKKQCMTKEIELGNINDINLLQQNLAENSIPENIFDMTVDNYDTFLIERRKLMSNKIKEYYYSL